MLLEIRKEPLSNIADHAGVPISFTVDRILDAKVRDNQPGGFELTERQLPVPYVKDYDSIEGNHPTDWQRQFDISHWELLAAYLDNKRVGGAVIAFNTNGVHLLEGRPDVAILWDLRVSPEHRGCGIGKRLFAAAMQRAKARGCRLLKIETQNINVSACKFYSSQGCRLVAANSSAYPEFPDETELIWHKVLSDA